MAITENGQVIELKGTLSLLFLTSSVSDVGNLCELDPEMNHCKRGYLKNRIHTQRCCLKVNILTKHNVGTARAVSTTQSLLPPPQLRRKPSLKPPDSTLQGQSKRRNLPNSGSTKTPLSYLNHTPTKPCPICPTLDDGIYQPSPSTHKYTRIQPGNVSENHVDSANGVIG
ncbi:uncharacterized protein EI90DRAFT_371425 [Cantharellus anzutake]|uniref:uncharacterized protein n=1 Tax=Cantharellus anzutake TaxID=1750568 RepID=UPI0019063548|nr:uncharacterized protein EI90DRAFT_371425 [Cantharellus anzutake]KAF8334882.1 hypothetical protein EI90DRAFT_371425 [Cantharellus anzutake]